MKNIKIIIAGLLIMMLFSASDCHNKDYEYFFIKNLYNRAIYYSTSDYYPDTSIVKEYRSIGPINPTEEIYFDAGYDGFKRKDTLIFFIFDAETIEQVPWDTIISKYMILKRFELSEEDVRNMNDTITFY